uniref:Uncharacterized protein n=1 Tax=Oryza barthii TaxID=65489 RepID=A0A0D3FZ04_9ORYZ
MKVVWEVTDITVGVISGLWTRVVGRNNFPTYPRLLLALPSSIAFSPSRSSFLSPPPRLASAPLLLAAPHHFSSLRRASSRLASCAAAAVAAAPAAARALDSATTTGLAAARCGDGEEAGCADSGAAGAAGVDDATPTVDASSSLMLRPSLLSLLVVPATLLSQRTTRKLR